MKVLLSPLPLFYIKIFVSCAAGIEVETLWILIHNSQDHTSDPSFYVLSYYCLGHKKSEIK